MFWSHRLLTVSSAPSASVTLATDQAAASNVGQCRGLTITQSYINVLALAVFGSSQEGSHDAVAGVETSS